MTAPTTGTVPCPNVAGKLAIYIDTGSTNALEFVGYSINGVEMEEQTFMSDVPGDENGGVEGPPVDIQHFGDIHYIRMELSKFNDTIVAKIRARLEGSTEASSITPGTLLFCGSYDYRLLLLGPNFTRNYTRAVPRGAIRMNAGTQFSRLMLEFACYRDANGVIWNTTSTY